MTDNRIRKDRSCCASRLLLLRGIGGRCTNPLKRLVRIFQERRAALERQCDECRRVKEASQREAAKLSAMISGMEEAVAFADAENRVVEINDYFCRFTGKRPEDVLGKRIEELHSGPAAETALAAIERFRANPGSPPLVVQRAIRGAHMIVRVQPIYRDGRYDGVLMNAVDVTELVEARLRAEAASAAKSQFLANISHEIRTPMTAILGYADLMMDQESSPGDRVEYLAVIRRNGEHLLALLDDILDLSKIEAGQMSLEIGPCNLAALVAEIAGLMRWRADERGIALALEFAGPVPEVIQTDATRLRQALINLVGNAVKFTEAGSVRIRLGLLSEWRPGQPAVRIEVIDTGIGVPREIQPRLFELFLQADSSLSRRFGGTGLGLAITHRIVEMLGGELTVQSVVGEGSTFAIVVPAGDTAGVRMVTHAPTAETEASGGRRPAPQELAGVRVLLAEDGRDNQVLIEMILAKAGAFVEIAENGRAAVDMALSGRFDVILMDIQMPDMDGYEATRTLRELGYEKPILALTAHALTTDAERCLAAGCNTHLSKPIDRTVLIRTIAEFVGRPAMTENAPAGVAAVPIRSCLADNPDVRAILPQFVGGLACNVAAMEVAMSDGRLAEVSRSRTRLRGTAGSYGYPELTEAAGTLDDAANAGRRAAAGAALQRIEATVRAVRAGLTERTDAAVRAGKP